METSRNFTVPVHGNTHADDVFVSQNLTKIMMATADAARTATTPVANTEAEAKALAGGVVDRDGPKSPGHIPHVAKGFLDPLVDTGRGSWVLYSKTTLEKLLASFDRAYPEHTNSSRESVIKGWQDAEEWIKLNEQFNRR